jgi:hypothetical protein
LMIFLAFLKTGFALIELALATVSSLL